MYEIQFHPADIRKQVRYNFLSRRGFVWLIVGGVVAATLVATGAALAPLGIQSLLLTSELHVLAHQNRLQREILEQRDGALAALAKRVQGARFRQRQLSLILGAPLNSQGQGGYPDPPVIDTSVLEAQLALRRALKLDTEAKALLSLADELARFASENIDLTQSVPSICPLSVGSFVLTSPFGERISPFTNTADFHAGIDLAAREGTPVMATGGGRVVFAGRFPLSRDVRWWRYGNVVVVAHGERYITIYAHLEEISVRRGSEVRRGDKVGTVGNTGWSTSPHLHYEVRVLRADSDEPQPIDPRIYILNYQWKGHEAMLIAGRDAPAPAFDPLPSRLKAR